MFLPVSMMQMFIYACEYQEINAFESEDANALCISVICMNL